MTCEESDNRLFTKYDFTIQGVKVVEYMVKKLSKTEITKNKAEQIYKEFLKSLENGTS